MQCRARRSLLGERALKPAEEQRRGWRSSPALLICSSLWHSFAPRVLPAMSHTCEDNEVLKHTFALIHGTSSSTQRRTLEKNKIFFSYQTLPLFLSSSQAKMMWSKTLVLPLLLSTNRSCCAPPSHCCLMCWITQKMCWITQQDVLNYRSKFVKESSWRV